MKEEPEGLCAVQALLHALTVKGRCHCWETLSTREAGLQPDTWGGAQSPRPDSHQSPYWNPSMNAKRLHIDLPEGARCGLTLSAVTVAGSRLSRGRVENCRQYVLWEGT